MSDERREPFGQHGAGRANLVREIRNVQLGRIGVQARQRAAHDRVAQTTEPTRTVADLGGRAAAQHLDEHELGDPPEHRAASCTRISGLSNGELDERVQPSARLTMETHSHQHR